MPLEQIRLLLNDVQERAAGDISMRDGKVVYAHSQLRRWPQINRGWLLTLYGDHPDDWPAITREYLAMAENDPPESEREPPPTKPEFPLRIIGETHDMFNSELRPVYNREPLAAERPARSRNPRPKRQNRRRQT